MVIRELVNKSWYGTIGYISSKEDLDSLEGYIKFNFDILKEFKNLIIATNYKDFDLKHSLEFRNYNFKLWRSYFKDCVLVDLNINRGHNHGNADLDNSLIDYCKQNNIDWICKSANDVIMTPEFLDVKIDESDFYYFNGIGYGGMIQYDFDLDRIMKEDFYPQTNFYFINASKVDYLNDKQYLNETYEYIKTIPNYNGRIWEYVKKWSCEDFLKQCVNRNNLSKYHLISNEKYRDLLELIQTMNIHDCSHKNIMIEGVCHLQWPEQQIIQI